MFASRLWWLLRWMGHDGVAVLDGGFAKWTRGTAADIERSREPAGPHVYRRTARADDCHGNGSGVCSSSPDWRLVDARAPERYRGDVEPLDPVAGHIPGAVNHFYQRNLDAGTFRRPEDLRAGIAWSRWRHQRRPCDLLLRIGRYGVPQPARAGARGAEWRASVSRLVERVGVGSESADRARLNDAPTTRDARSARIPRLRPSRIVVLCSVHQRQAGGARTVAARTPVLLDDGVEHLVEVLVAAGKRFPEDAFRHGTDLEQRLDAASVLDGAARFEAMHADALEGELQQQRRTLFEDAGTPERRADGKAPFGCIHGAAKLSGLVLRRADLTHLEQPDGGVVAAERGRKARPLARRAQPL